MLVHPSREVRYDCSKPKGNTYIQVVFTQSPVSLTTTSEYLPASGILDPLCICTRFHKQLQLFKERKSYLTCLRHCKLFKQTPVKYKTWKTNSQQSFLFRFKIQFKTVSTSYTVQVVSNDSPYVPIKRTHNCSSNYILGYLMHLTNQTNFPQTGKHSSLRCQLTVSTPSSTVPSVP